ncbi:MAG: hypothetical protein RDU89_05375 [bacterium]|nr:hypothetical protein [bacterium]
MVLVAHAAVGGALGASAGRRSPAWSPLWVAGWALLSHVILDAIPHWDNLFALGWLIADLAAALAVAAIIARLARTPGRVFWGAFLACLPDLEHLLVGWLLPQRIFLSHLPWFPHGQAALVPGVLTQLLVVIMAIAFVARQRAAGAPVDRPPRQGL